MKEILAVMVVFFLASTLLYTPATRGQSSSLDNTLVVCVGAHPDDIEIAISGSLYKNEIGKHPILWLIVTDGGADFDEYQYESDASRNWLVKDGQVAITWKAPDGSNVTRQFYSADLAEKRCGGYFDGLSWKEEAASHDSTFGVEYDWRTRVSSFVDATIMKSQLSYLEPSNPTKLLMYPDGALANAESAFTNSIAKNLASEIDKFVESNGYEKSLMKMYSHAPEEVCTNANEQPDHRVTGNAVREAIDILLSTYGFGRIDAKWYTVYSPIDPKPGYLRVDEDISQQQTQKSELAKACWETDAIHLRSINYTWNDYPDDPGHYEYSIAQSYYALVHLSDFDLLFTNNTVRAIYPSDSATKPLGCSAAWVSDWTASAFVTTKLKSFTEGTDTNANFVNQTTGKALGSSGTGMVSFGGPIVNPIVKNAENQSTVPSDRAPVRWQASGDMYRFQCANGTDITGTELSTSLFNSSDMFVLEVYRDGDGRNIMLCYGFGWKGTYAAGKYFHTVIYPNLGSYNVSWILVKWTDANGDSFVNGPNDGDTYTVIASG